MLLVNWREKKILALPYPASPRIALPSLTLPSLTLPSPAAPRPALPCRARPRQAKPNSIFLRRPRSRNHARRLQTFFHVRFFEGRLIIDPDHSYDSGFGFGDLNRT